MADERQALFVPGVSCSSGLPTPVQSKPHFTTSPTGKYNFESGGGVKPGDSGGKEGDSHQSNNRPAKCPFSNVVTLPSAGVVALCHV
jgi:hypothetical protein